PPPTILITGATPPMDPASSTLNETSFSLRPNHVLNPDSVQVPFELLRWSQDRSKRREGSPLKDNEKVQGWIKEYLMYTHERDRAIFRTDTGRGGRNPGASMGTITFRSPTTLPGSLERMRTELAAIETDKVVSALFFIAFGVFLLEEDPDVDVQMKREWYVMLRDMILMGVSGEGKAVSLNDVAKWDHYLLMGKKLNDALKDPNISEKQMNEFFDLRKKQTGTLTEYYT
ncbi:hypothetical protein F5880DRAFT_1510315, partial [Lentinula raphanica]